MRPPVSGLFLLLAQATACPAGLYQSASTCVSCPAGTYKASATANVGCLPCPAGTYSNVLQATNCTACPPGQTTYNLASQTLVYGQTACTYCPAPLMLSGGSTGCIACTANHFCNGTGIAYPCSEPILHRQYVLPSEACTASQDALVMPCSGCLPTEYVAQPCTTSSDTVCGACSVCAGPFLQYTVTQCNQTHDTVCAACSKARGDMQVGGICNPCPPGAYYLQDECLLCEAGTFSAYANAPACQRCPSNSTSGAGATRCVTQCAPGFFSPDANGVCVPLASAQSLVSAWDPSFLQIQAAAPYPVAGQFLVARVVLGTPFLYVLGAGASWLLAGSAGALPKDGMGQEAVLRSITNMAWDPDSQGYLLVEAGGYLRWVTPDGNVSSLTFATEVHPWTAVSYTGQPGQFFLGAPGVLMVIDVGARTQQAWLQGLYEPLMPLGMWVDSSRTLYLLDQGLILSLSPPTLVQVCGGGATPMQGAVGEAVGCMAVSLAESGALDIAWVNEKLYVLLFNAAWSGVGLVQDSTVTLLWAQDPCTPLRLLGYEGNLFMVARMGGAQGAEILLIGDNGGCLCGDPGLVCNEGLQCVDAPIGSMAPGPWAVAPVPCPVGSYRQAGQVQCTPCPPNYTTTQSGSWFCVSSCPNNNFFLDLSTQSCLAGCNASAGLYHDEDLGQCLPCWLGSGSSGGLGLASCRACPPQSYGLRPGVCAPCPLGTTTETPGTTRCMSPGVCQDGGATCPPVHSVSPLAAPFAQSLLVIPNGTYVLGETPHMLQQYSATLDMVYQARYGDSAIYRGDGGLLAAAGTLPPLYSLALMEPVLLASSMLAVEEGVPPCAEVYAVSVYDGGVTHFMSQDVLKQPTILLTQCILSPIVLAVCAASQTLFAAVGPALYASSLTLGSLQTLLVQTPILQLDQGTITHVLPSTSGAAFFLGTSLGQIQSVPWSTFDMAQWQTVVVQSPNGVVAMGAAGRRVLFLDSGGQLAEILFDNVEGCMAGYVPTQLNTASLWGVCMQAGRGFFTLNGQLQSCPAGTYGPSAGALRCLPCPSGTVAAGAASGACTPCEQGQLSSADGTQCLDGPCPPGSWRNGSVGCATCPPGYVLTAPGACLPCPAGTYVPLSSGTACQECPAGYASLAGAHACVVKCAVNAQCAYDGQSCQALNNDYRVLSQILMLGGGQVMGLAVDSQGGVFFTDGTTIQYYLDDCASYDTQCTKTGANLLPPGQYAGYMFSALAICNVPESSAACTVSRKLYAASLIYSSIYVLEVCQDGFGNVNATATAMSDTLRLVAGRSWAGFMDGPLNLALFNQPVDLELDAACGLLYVSDFANHRIRRMNLTAGTVSTAVGTGQACWKEGLVSCSASGHGCDPSYPDCASIEYPLGIGLSQDETALYLAANTVDAVYMLSGGALSRVCSFTYTNMARGTVQECALDAAESKGCMLHQPFDVATYGMDVFVGATQGVTCLFGSAWTCAQIAGQYFGLQATGFRDGVMPQSDGNSSSFVSLVNVPFKLAVSKGNAVLYFADMLNSAVRRIQVQTACICPQGYVLVPGAASCYNPSVQEPVPLCSEPGYYALPGDATCFRSCAQALAQGLTAAPCLTQQYNEAQFGAMAYAQLLGQLSPPQNTLAADWYGFASVTPPGGWDAIFNPSSTVTYRQGSVPGRAPSSNGNFVSLTWAGCWSIESTFALQPQLILPGLWYPCGPVDGGCVCPGDLFAFAQASSTQVVPPRWEDLRNAAVEGRAVDPSGCSTPDVVLLGACGVPLTQSSVFLMAGTDQSAPHACPQQEEGPCFQLWQHHVGSENGASVELTLGDISLWTEDCVLGSLQCRLGWPAHFYCPNGYVWIAPSNFEACTTPSLPALATCLSCLPGTYSFADMQQRQTLGGPYQCLACAAGFFASAVGSTGCEPCPANTYASAVGSAVCEACPNGTFTVLAAAYTQEQCVACPPGTGSCAACVPGEFQTLSGQVHCQVAPAGYYSPSPSAVAPLPCGAGQYQDLQGRTSCKQCPTFTVTMGGAATACLHCPPSSTGCALSLGNLCGVGCGLNQYWDWGAGICKVCPQGTLNAVDTCATDPNACFESPVRSFFLAPNGSIAACAPGGQANATYNGCEPCAQGLFSNANSGGCQACEPGTYAAKSGSTTCTACQAGFSSVQGSPSCAFCEPGEYAPVPGSMECWPCPAGTVSALPASTDCTRCPENQVAPTSGMAACNSSCNVSLGYYAPPGSSACSYCADGIVNQSLVCEGCGLGHYLGIQRACQQCAPGLVNLDSPEAVSASACAPCPSPTAYASADGTFCIEASPGFVPASNGTGQVMCPAGTYRNSTQTVCTPCPRGWATSGGRPCALCSPGFYTPEAGLSVCIACASGTVTQAQGSSSCTPCAAGSRESSGVACLPCPPNTFSLQGASICDPCLGATYSMAGATACTTCPAWTVFDSAIRGCGVCAPGSYMMALGSKVYECQDCLPGAPLSGKRGGWLLTPVPLCEQAPSITRRGPTRRGIASRARQARCL